METSAKLVESGAKARVPHKTGRLRASIGSDVTGIGSSIQGHVWADADYAQAVEDGTRPHDIAPVSAMALMVPVAPMGGFGGGRLSGAPRSGQGVAFFARVRHPGTRPYPYLVPALEDARPFVQAIFTKAADAVLAKIAAQAKATLGLFGKL